jgi:UDPglucose--hexose-1-phosphate uridylyltransferase
MGRLFRPSPAPHLPAPRGIYNPLRPAGPEDQATELPPGQYDIAVFENRFPALLPGAASRPPAIVATAPANGASEVVVFTQDETTSLGALPLDHIVLLLEVWADRCRELGAQEAIQYVMPFENRGVEVGVTLHHPHGQI